MRTIRFVPLFIVGLAAFMVGRVPPAVAQPAPVAPCAAIMPATWLTTAPALATNMTRMVAPRVLEPNNWDEAALQGCHDLKSLITPGNYKLLGFEHLSDASLAEIAIPFEVYTIGLHALRKYNPEDSVTLLVKKSDSRLYPVLINRIVRSSLVVSLDKGTPVTTGWGLTKLIGLVTDPDLNKAPTDFIVWIPALNLHFLGDPSNDTLMLTPLATRDLYGLKKGTPISAAVVFALLAQQARAHDDNTPG